MLKLAISLLFLVFLPGCSMKPVDDMVAWKYKAMGLEPPAYTQRNRSTPTRLAALPEEGVPRVVAPPLEDPAVTRAKYCEWARAEFKLPVLFNRNLKEDANEKLGKDNAAKLFWPAANTNNSFRCICGTPDERKIAKCV